MKIINFSAMTENTLLIKITDLVINTPPEIIQKILDTIKCWKGLPSDFQKMTLLSSIQNPQIKSKLRDLLDCWEIENSRLSLDCIVLSIQATLRTHSISKQNSFELIWTGPENLSNSFRRTDQALLELINGANEQLLIVSFAVYKAKLIIDAIEQAIQRNVNVVICLEDSNESQGKLSVSGNKVFSKNIFNLATFYTWPFENRPRNLDGKFGSLHAKLAVADRNRVFISSANLTDYAMDLNLELGVLINDKSVGEQITDLFENLFISSVLRKMNFFI